MTKEKYLARFQIIADAIIKKYSTGYDGLTSNPDEYFVSIEWKVQKEYADNTTQLMAAVEGLDMEILNGHHLIGKGALAKIKKNISYTYKQKNR